MSSNGRILGEIKSLTGLRFIAALLVCFAHTFPKVIPGCCVLVTQFAAEGMTLFFVLSGFVIHYNYSHSIENEPLVGTYNFFMARFARLYPLFIICFILELTHKYGYSNLTPDFYEVVEYYLSLTQSWFYKIFGHNALIYQFGLMSSVAWSISTEWFFYLCYPLIYFIFLRNAGLRTIVLISLILILLVPVAMLIIGHEQALINKYAVSTYGPLADAGSNHQDSFFRWIVYFSPYTRVFEFILGCFTASIYMKLSCSKLSVKEEQLGLSILICVIVALAIAHSIIFYPPGRLSMLKILHCNFGFAPLMALLIFCCARYDNLITRFLSNRPMLWGGAISYSLYMLHLPIAEAFSRDAAPVTSFKVGLADGARYILTIGAILGISYISYNIIEVPARKFLRKKLTISRRDALLTNLSAT